MKTYTKRKKLRMSEAITLSDIRSAQHATQSAETLVSRIRASQELRRVELGYSAQGRALAVELREAWDSGASI